jgi:hypothetical protein
MAAPSESVEKFALTRPFNEPLNPVREKRGAVVVLAPESPEQSGLTVPLALLPLEPEEEPEAGTDKESDGRTPNARRRRPGEVIPEEELTPEELRLREKFGPLQGTTNRGRAAGGGLLGRNEDDDEDEGMMSGQAGMYGYGENGRFQGMQGAYVENKRVKLAAGISVRYLFNLREERKRIADALHIDVASSTAAMYAEDFNTLEIERKQAVSASDPWSGEWEPVLVDDLAEILNESLSLDLEVVNPLVTRSVITMALPRRAQGRWSADEVSHKGISNFVLSDEEKEIIRKRDEKLAKEMEERKALIPETRVQRGFAGFRGDANRLMSQLNSNDPNSSDAFTRSFLEEFNTADPAAAAGGVVQPKNARTARNGRQPRMKPEELEKLRKKLFDPDATNRLLLVRFIDFTAERGQEYIYRVRLVMNNPNFGAPIDELEQPELSAQPTIFSDWSVPTQPVLLPLEYHYYVNSVKSSVQGAENASLAMHYEDVDRGTAVMTDLQVPAGIRIGGEKEVDVVDLAKSILGPAKVDFRSRDLLCGVTEAPRLNSSDHPELQPFLSKVPRGKKPIPDQMLVLTSSGSLAMRFTGDRPEAEREDRTSTGYVIKEYERIGWRETNQPVYNQNEDDEDGGLLRGGALGLADPLAGGNRGRRGDRGGRSNRGRGRGMSKDPDDY